MDILSQCTTFVREIMTGMGHKFRENFTSIQTKNLQTCVCATHLSGKCRHCKTVSSRSNVVCRPETALMLICDRRCAQLTCCAWVKKIHS